MQATPPESMPHAGSDEAVAQGCICPRMDNNYGRGTEDYSINTYGCALHWPKNEADDTLQLAYQQEFELGLNNLIVHEK